MQLVCQIRRNLQMVTSAQNECACAGKWCGQRTRSTVDLQRRKTHAIAPKPVRKPLHVRPASGGWHVYCTGGVNLPSR